jgi:hypothetical protein
MGWGIRRLFERLGTTPLQEERILSAVGRVRDDREIVRDELEKTRQDLARAVRGGVVDDGAFEELFARHDRLLAQLRVSVVEALKETVEVLDERQRTLVADRLDGRGVFGGGWHGHVWA